MKVLTSFGASFLSALVTILGLMFAFTLFDSHAFKPLVAMGIATGMGLASAIRAWKEPSLNASALLTGALVGIGFAVGTWFSNG